MPRDNAKLPEGTPDLPKGKSGSEKGIAGLARSSLEVAQASDPPLMVDGSLWLHAPKALLWLACEASVIALSCYDYYVSESVPCGA